MLPLGNNFGSYDFESALVVAQSLKILIFTYYNSLRQNVAIGHFYSQIVSSWSIANFRYANVAVWDVRRG